MSLKNQLIFGFIGFTALFLFTVFPINLNYLNRKEDILTATNYLDSYYLDLIHTWQIQSDFLNYETRNSEFFRTNKSKYLEELKIKEDSLDKKFEHLITICKKNKFEADDLLDLIQQKINEKSVLFDQMVQVIYLRGFKDYGIEGKLRENAHKLETYYNFDLAKVLTLRRHEKDYIIRNDSSYIIKLNNLVDQMLTDVKKNPTKNNTTKLHLANLLANYKTDFNRLVSCDSEIGVRSKSGYMAKIDEKNQEIETLLAQAQNLVSSKKNDLFSYMEMLYLISSIVLILIAVLISLYLSKLITKPFTLLTKSIKELVLTNFEKPLNIKVRNSQKEITILTTEFNRMIEQLHHKEKARQEAHNYFLESELKYKDLSNLLPQGVFESDSNGILTYVNENWKNQLLYTDSDIKNGIKFSDLITYDSKVDQDLNQENNHDKKVIRKNGSTFHAMIVTNKIVRNNQIIGERGIIIDISERINYINELKKEKAKAEESDKLKSAFLANMSHEIRTPMNAIIGFSEMLKEDELSAEDRNEYISIINANGESLLKLIEDIIDIAKIESGHISIMRADTNLHKLSTELILSLKEIKKQNQKHKVELINLNGNDLIEEIVITDPHRLRQILINLLTNAVKFTNEGFIRFGFTISEDQSKIIFVVQDSGIGIAKIKQKIIFERFRKVNDNQDRLYAGTGLGLYITKTLIKMLGGEIWMDSVPGIGSNFYFSLPYEKSLIKTSLNVQKLTHHQVNLSGLNILVAEDIDTNFLLIKSILKASKINLFWVKNGIEAVDFLLDNNKTDLILMDVGMPIMNGYEATQQIKLILPEIPIIMQTANAMSGDREKCLNFGADEYISKPINPGELIGKIRRLIQVRDESIVD
jgi:PAS domain S-box-containing protein